MMPAGTVWHVRSYPHGHSLHQADTYEACDEWRHTNDPVSYICPEFPDSPTDGDAA